MTDQGGTSPVASCLETTACQPLYYQASTAKDAEHAARPDVTLPHLRSVHYKVTTATTSGPGIRCHRQPHELVLVVPAPPRRNSVKKCPLVSNALERDGRSIHGHILWEVGWQLSQKMTVDGTPILSNRATDKQKLSEQIHVHATGRRAQAHTVGDGSKIRARLCVLWLFCAVEAVEGVLTEAIVHMVLVMDNSNAQRNTHNSRRQRPVRCGDTIHRKLASISGARCGLRRTTAERIKQLVALENEDLSAPS